jgi:hypothetical protein
MYWLYRCGQQWHRGQQQKNAVNNVSKAAINVVGGTSWQISVRTPSTVDDASTTASDHCVPEMRVRKLHENCCGPLRRDICALSHWRSALRQTAPINSKLMAHSKQL